MVLQILIDVLKMNLFVRFPYDAELQISSKTRKDIKNNCRIVQWYNLHLYQTVIINSNIIWPGTCLITNQISHPINTLLIRFQFNNDFRAIRYLFDPVE